MQTRAAVLLGIACFGGGTLVGALLLSGRVVPARVSDVAPAEGPVLGATAPAGGAAGGDLQAEVELLRTAVQMAESECTSRFVAAGCVEHVAWPAGTDPEGTARRLSEAMRACPHVDPESVHVDCDEYPCGVAYRLKEDGDGPDPACPTFDDLVDELSPRGFLSGMSLTTLGETRVTMLMPALDAPPDVVASAALRAPARLRTLGELATAEPE